MDKRLRLLLVEDSEDDALLTLRVLSRSGYQIASKRVENAPTLREALLSQAWDVILSDYSMPQFSGADALRVLQQTGLDLPFIIVSGAIGEERAVEIMKAGAHDYVMKDNLARLLPALERELREADGRRARKAAEQQVYLLSQALEQSPSLVIITNTAGFIEYINPAFTHISGYSAEEVVGSHSNFLFASDTQVEEIQQQVWATVRAGENWRGEVRSRKKNGDLYWVETVISTIRNSAGEITEFLAVQEDISQRKRLETEVQRYTTQLEKMVEERTAELRRAKDQIELILNNTSDALALAQPNGDIQTVNPAFLATFNELSSQSIENILSALNSDEQVALVSNALLNVIYNCESKRLEAQISTGDDKDKDIDLTLIPVQMTGDDPRFGVLVSARDITQMKEIERFKAKFVADAVHDLATPITGLSTRLYLLKRNPEQITEHIRALENQVEHLRNLLDDLRTLSQLDRSQIVLNREPVNLNDLVQRVFDTYAPLAAQNDQSLIFAAAPTLPPVELDRRQFEQIVVNLVSNAFNYTPAHKNITITTAVEENQVIFAVRDQGIGISAEDLPHIFDRFYRATAARRTQSNGTGLGLAIVKEIVELHGGTVTAESKLGKGSTFTVRLPLA